MKNAIIALLGILSINSLNAQFDEYTESDGKLDPTLQAKFDSVNTLFNKIESEFPTWKTGDDNSHLKGLLRSVFNDYLAKDLYRSDETVSLLHVTGFNTIHNGTIVSEWITTLNQNLYPSDQYSMRYNDDGEIEHLWIFDLTGRMVREITIIWDDTYDGVNYTNMRTIMDSYFNRAAN
jgi:hypothetical protein